VTTRFLSTLCTVDARGYRQSDMTAAAEKMYMRALQGKEKAWGAEHMSAEHSRLDYLSRHSMREPDPQVGTVAIQVGAIATKLWD
jgi:hypothetical protein